MITRKLIFSKNTTEKQIIEFRDYFRDKGIFVSHGREDGCYFIVANFKDEDDHKEFVDTVLKIKEDNKRLKCEARRNYKRTMGQLKKAGSC